jgi:ubiquinone/menaquinone biosynthesis C-methylase UbiE
MTERAELPPPNIAFVQLAMAATTAEEFARLLDGLAAGPGRTALHAMAKAHPDSWHTVRRILTLADHAALPADPAARVSAVACLFDEAAAISPEASVALYSLGDARLLAAATAEVVAWLGAAGAAGPDTRLLDFGCGIGRLALTLAPAVASVMAVDISAAMIEETRRRCAAFGNVTAERIGGLDLTGFADASFDTIVALDSMPYVVGNEGSAARAMLAEMARVLAPGGHLCILNYSYRGDPAADVAELGAFAVENGFSRVVRGARPFQHWDGLVYHLHRS